MELTKEEKKDHLDAQIAKLNSWLGQVEDDPTYWTYLKEWRDRLVAERENRMSEPKVGDVLCPKCGLGGSCIQGCTVCPECGVAVVTIAEVTSSQLLAFIDEGEDESDPS